MEGKANKKILILLDKRKVLEHGINLGDTALSLGLYDLIKKHGQVELVSGGWKNFPYLNYKKLARDFAKYGSVDKVLECWFEEIQILAKKISPNLLKYLLLDSPVVQNDFVRNRELLNRKKYNFSYLDKIRANVLKPYMAKVFIRKVKNADLVIFSGGGSLRDHNKSHVPGYLFEIYMAKMLGKIMIASNFTLYLHDPLLKDFAKAVLSKVDFNLAREPFTQQALRDMDIEGSKIALIKKMKFIITDRYHATIFSVMAGTPFIPVNAKTHKIEGFIKMIDYPINEFEKTNEDNLRLTKSNIDFLLANRSEISDELMVKSNILNENSNEIFKNLLNDYLY